MKKYIVMLVIFILILSGCSKKEELDFENYYDLNTYKIFEPYQQSVSGNYINYMISNNYDVDNIQSRLMDLSSKYFKTSNYYYQAGQYLDINSIKELLNDINPDYKVNIDGIEMIPKYITYIHEQNYLDKNGDLAGISIGLALNKYQSYKNNYGATLYKEISEEELVKYAKEKIKDVLSYLRNIDNLKDKRILIGLYINASPNSTLPGSYKYFGITSDNNISFKAVDFSYHYLDSNNLTEKNVDVYNGFKAFQGQINLDNIYISGYGLFEDNNLVNASITITSDYLNRDKLIYLESIISKALGNNFQMKSIITVYIKVNNQIVGMVKKDNNNQIFNYIL
ncbi:MAG: hypothetical protein E7165_01820 [Firmicutes bacterium]|nr:hypothetical protein [Bacillota bacterium]